MCSYLVIPNYNLIKVDFHVSDTLLGLMSGLFLFLNGVAALVWSYFSDTTLIKRKVFLVASMSAAGLFTLLTYTAQSFFSFFIFRILTGASLGSILPLGFSILSDTFDRSRRTSIFMLWYVLGGFGLGLGFGMSVLLGNYFSWRLPLFYGGVILLIVGALVSATLLEPERGSAEEELEELINKGIRYKYRFKPSDLALILENKSNFFAALQGVLGTIPNGIIFTWALQYIIRDLGTTELVGSILLGIMSIGALGGFLVSYAADKLYQYNVAIRPVIAGFCSIFESILFIMFFSVPLRLDIYDKDVFIAVQKVFSLLFSNFFVLLTASFFFFAMFFNSAVGPIRNSVLSDVNLPEHRATVLAGVTIVELFSKSIGIALLGFLADFFGSLRFPIILAMSFWIFSGLAWFYLAWYYGYDVGYIKGILKRRGKEIEKTVNS